MKSIRPLFLVFVLTAISAPAFATEEEDRNALRHIKATYEDAVNQGNPSALAPYLSDSVTAVMVTGEEVSGLPGLENYWKKVRELIGPDGTYQVKVDTDKTEFFGDLAISRGKTEEMVRLGNGKEFHFSSLWSTVCRRENGSWKVLRMHASLDPVDNAFVAAKMQALKITYGLIGVVLASFLALLFFFFWRRRSTAA